jgi:signal transduction histidine kinase
VNVQFRPTIRLRLTLLYGGLFLAAGAVLLGVNYALVRRGLDDQIRPVQVELAEPGTAVIEGPPGDELLFRAAPFAEDPSDVLNQFQDRIRDRALHELVIQSGLALGLMAVASVGLGWLIAGRVLRPLQHVTATARQLSEANLDRRLDLQGPRDELKELADTFDAMLERLQRAFESQRRFVANASHELRTPLAVQRTLVDVALADPDATNEDLRAMAVSVSEAIDRSEHLIDSLLVLARSEQGLTSTEELDLADVGARAVDQLAAEADRSGVRIERVLGHAPVRGNAVLLERLVANLVQNGVRYNRRGGWVEVTTRAEGGRAAVEVRNSGPVVPPEEVDGLFEPFRRRGQDRVDSARGVGLGLSIVRAVARAHGGSVKADAPAAGGLSVRVDLPSPARERAPAQSLSAGSG